MSHIIVGVDLSKDSEVAAAHAVALAKRRGSKVVLATATTMPAMSSAYSSLVAPQYEIYRDSVRAELAEDRASLEALRESLLGRGVEISCQVVDSPPKELLPKLADDLDASLIVVGSHGRTGLKRALLGSVAEHVVRHSPTSVYVARGPAPIDGFSHVVVGTAFDEESEKAVQAAAKLVVPGGRLDVVHCWQMQAMLYRTEAWPAFELADDIESRLRVDGAKVVAQIDRADITVGFHAVQSTPSWGLIDWATKENADLIVTGTHGRHGLGRLFLGSVAELTVRHSTCSVLVCR